MVVRFHVLVGVVGVRVVGVVGVQGVGGGAPGAGLVHGHPDVRHTSRVMASIFLTASVAVMAASVAVMVAAAAEVMAALISGLCALLPALLLGIVFFLRYVGYYLIQKLYSNVKVKTSKTL